MANSDTTDTALPTPRTIKLCGVIGCCPEIEFKADGNVEIRDDFGGKVKLTRQEFDELQRVGSAE